MKRLIAPVLLATMMVMSVAMMVARSVQAQNETIIFTAQLLAGNEVPPVAVNPTEAGANGSATVTLNVTRSGSTITAATAQFDVSLTGLASNSRVILTHIHEGGSAVNGPVRVDSGITPATGIPAPVAVSFSRSNLTVAPAVAQGIIDNPGGWYFNVHTALSGGGVARGQLVRPQQVGGTPAPTLSEWGAILMTLLFIATGVFFLLGRRTALAGDGAVTTSSTAAIDWKLYVKVALVTEAAIGAVLAALRVGSVDALGALASGLVLAFIIHLFILNARQRR